MMDREEPPGADTKTPTANAMKQPSYTISDLSKEFDITPRSIRFYEDQGLLSPVRKGRQRVFYERDHVRLRLILRGKRLGFSLADVKEIIGLYDAEMGEQKQLSHLLDKIDERRTQLEQQQRDIVETLGDLENVEERVKKALKRLNAG